MAVFLIDELLGRLPEDCEQRVLRAKDEFNRLVRNHLGKETNLSLRGKRGTEHDDAEIPVKVKPGLPSALENLLSRVQEDSIEVLIALFEDDLEKLRASAHEVIRLLSGLSKYDPDLPECDGRYASAMSDSIDVANRLLQRISSAYLEKSIFAVQDDILGIYKPTGSGGEVELFWAAIGIGARLLNVKIEDLTAVVLIHELAHGYTHLGRDGDNESWDTDWMFRRVDRAVVEGLAQYYTDIISERLGDTKAVGVHEAYLNLRRRQRGYYRVHDRWVESCTSEVVRSALLEYRRNGCTGRNDFERMLHEQSKRLNAKPKEPHQRVKDDIRKNGPLEEEYQDLIDDLLIRTSNGTLSFSDPGSFFVGLRQEWEIAGEHHLAAALSEWTIAIDADFRKTTQGLDRGLKGRLFDVIQEIVSAPLSPRGDTVKRLTGDFEGLWRYRIGDYRLLYRVDRLGRQVVFLKCEHRSSVYDN
jgi:mRNA-degrading endonuclease RelE of RelBE toxin-antitoxin system